VLHQAVGALVVIATVWGMHLLGRNPAVVSTRSGSARLSETD
jgi:hypothetical protein